MYGMQNTKEEIMALTVKKFNKKIQARCKICNLWKKCFQCSDCGVITCEKCLLIELDHQDLSPFLMTGRCDKCNQYFYKTYLTKKVQQLCISCCPENLIKITCKFCSEKKNVRKM